MRKHSTILAMGLALGLSGCGFGESRLNPFNWFRSGPESEVMDPVDLTIREDSRPLVAEVTSLSIERTPGGAIIRATGLPPEQGWYDAALVNEDRDGEPVNGTLLFSIRALPPFEPTRVSTVQSRELTVAVFVSEFVLARTSRIQVTAARNSRTASK